jgi:hypothetical protein
MVGRYSGQQTITLAVPDQPDIAPTTDTGGFTADVTSNSITIIEEGVSATGSVDAAGNFGIANGTLSVTLDDGTACPGELAYNGRITGSSLTGSYTGSANCAGVTISLDGTYSASLSASGKLSAGLSSIINSYVK